MSILSLVAGVGLPQLRKGANFSTLSSILTRNLFRLGRVNRTFSSRRAGTTQTTVVDRGRPEVHKNAKKHPLSASRPGTAFSNSHSATTGRATSQINATSAALMSGQAISWYPGHIAKAERELSEYLKKVDVVIEVRDARIPLSTTHPLVPTWVGRKPLLVAVTRLDQVSPLALAAWKAYYGLDRGRGRGLGRSEPDLSQRPGGNHSMKEAKDHADNSAGASAGASASAGGESGDHFEADNDNDNGDDDEAKQAQSPAKVFFIDGKSGLGVAELKAHALQLSAKVNLKRKRMGMQPRSIRAAVIGYPNVGKSALINRLIGRRKAVSKNMPGVTRSMQWIRIGSRDRDERAEEGSENLLELLDSPGIIPAKQVDQDVAVKLAICNDIGEASYDKVLIAEAMCDAMIALFQQAPQFVPMAAMEERYGLPVRAMSGDSILPAVADKYFHGSISSAAERLLSDFRKGHLGQCGLEAPPPPPFFRTNAAKAAAGAGAGAAVGGTIANVQFERTKMESSGSEIPGVDTERVRVEAGGGSDFDTEDRRATVEAPAGPPHERSPGQSARKTRQSTFSFPAATPGKFDGW
jgi:ribosome biogenesis GTPase A